MAMMLIDICTELTWAGKLFIKAITNKINKVDGFFKYTRFVEQQNTYEN